MTSCSSNQFINSTTRPRTMEQSSEELLSKSVSQSLLTSYHTKPDYSFNLCTRQFFLVYLVLTTSSMVWRGTRYQNTIDCNCAAECPSYPHRSNLKLMSSTASTLSRYCRKYRDSRNILECLSPSFPTEFMHSLLSLIHI